MTRKVSDSQLKHIFSFIVFSCELGDMEVFSILGDLGTSLLYFVIILYYF